MTPDELLAWVARDVPMVCICGRVIPDNAIVFGFPMSIESDEPMAYVNEWHDPCLREWGYVRCHEMDPDGIEGWGIKHATQFCPRPS